MAIIRIWIDLHLIGEPMNKVREEKRKRTGSKGISNILEE